MLINSRLCLRTEFPHPHPRARAGDGFFWGGRDSFAVGAAAAGGRKSRDQPIRSPLRSLRDTNSEALGATHALPSPAAEAGPSGTATRTEFLGFESARRNPGKPSIVARLHRGVVWLALLALAPGCGARGPDRYDISGKVTFRGQPVPSGYIVFAPDGKRGNDGPGCTVDIEKGAYASMPGRGTVGGPHQIQVYGFDGVPISDAFITNPMGKPIFPEHRRAVDLPHEAGQLDLEIPEK
jgi:hypothetical protein